MKERFCTTTITPGLPARWPGTSSRPVKVPARLPADAYLRGDADRSYRIAQVVGDIEFLVDHTVDPRDVVGILAWRMSQKDPGQKERGVRVASLAARLAWLATGAEDLSENLAWSARLHDIGAIAVPTTVLSKPGPFNDEEDALMRRHALVGFRILRGRGVALIEQAAWIAGTHHEWWDGSGYPFGLTDEEIPLAGRITAVADVYDALTHDRPYRRALESEAALALMDETSGSQFEPRLLDHLKNVIGEELAQ